MIDLMSSHTLPYYKRSTSAGYLNSDNEWVEAGFGPVTTITCNVQPFSDGKNKIILPDGVRTDSVIIIRSFTRMAVADHLTGEEGDEVEYEGHRYECFREYNFSEYSLMSDHYKYIFRRVDAS